MKPHHPRSTALRFLPLAVLLALGCLGMYLSLAAPVPEGKPTAYPAWWFEREVITRTDSSKASPVHPADYPPAADFAALNQGQLKQFATAAFDELQAHLPGGAAPPSPPSSSAGTSPRATPLSLMPKAGGFPWPLEKPAISPPSTTANSRSWSGTSSTACRPNSTTQPASPTRGMLPLLSPLPTTPWPISGRLKPFFSST